MPYMNKYIHMGNAYLHNTNVNLSNTAKNTRSTTTSSNINNNSSNCGTTNQSSSKPIFIPLPSLSSPFFSMKQSTVKCDAAPLPPPPPLPTSTTPTDAPPPPPPSSSPEEDSITQAAASATGTTSPKTTAVPNPGPYEMASMDAGKRIVTLDTHDGFRCDINKQLSPYFAVVHSFWLGTSMIPDGRNKTYSFVAQVADEMGLCMARIDPERRSVDGRVHMGVLGGLAMGKLQLGLSMPESDGKDAGGGAAGGGGGAGANDQALMELDFSGLTWTGNLKYGSMGGGLMFGCNYFQGVTKRLAIGGEGMYIGTNKALMSSYMLKYTFPNLSSTPSEDVNSTNTTTTLPDKDEKNGSAVLLANFNTGQGLLSLNYKRVVTPDRVNLAAELQCSPMTLDSQVTLGAEVALQRSKINLCVDGTGRIQSTLEAKLGMAPGSPSLTFAAEVDHGKDVMRFGYGLNIGG